MTILIINRIIIFYDHYDNYQLEQKVHRVKNTTTASTTPVPYFIWCNLNNHDERTLLLNVQEKERIKSRNKKKSYEFPCFIQLANNSTDLFTQFSWPSLHIQARMRSRLK